MVTLIVEDGTGLPNANTYITVEYARQYGHDRGIDLGEAHLIAQNLVLAADYISTKGPFKGKVLSLDQSLDFPRSGLQVHGEQFTGVPQKVKNAQAQLLLDIKESGALLTSNRQFALKKRQLEGLVQEWAVGSYAQYKPGATHVLFDSLMADYLRNVSGQAWSYR